MQRLVFLICALCMGLSSSFRVQPRCETQTFTKHGYDRIYVGSQTYDAVIYYEAAQGVRVTNDPHSGSMKYDHCIYTRSQGHSSPIMIKAQAVKQGYKNSKVAIMRVYFDEQAVDPEVEAEYFRQDVKDRIIKRLIKDAGI